MVKIPKKKKKKEMKPFAYHVGPSQYIYIFLANIKFDRRCEKILCERP